MNIGGRERRYVALYTYARKKMHGRERSVGEDGQGKFLEVKCTTLLWGMHASSSLGIRKMKFKGAQPYNKVIRE